MATYKLFASDLRCGGTRSDNGIDWYAPMLCDCALVDDNDNAVWPDGLDITSAVQTLWSSEPIEYTDDLTDLRRKAISGLHMMWTQLTIDDSVTVFWV